MTAETVAFPDSSNVASASYDAETQTMEVTFTSGSTYRAVSVPASKWAGLKDHPSAGSFYYRHLKGSHSWQRV